MFDYKFSLILPTLNRPQYIEECLISLREQEYTDFEVIVIDQSDDDKTKEVIQQFIDDRYMNIKYRKVNFKGLSKARNYGINMADGEYISLLDDDARYNKEFLYIAKDIIEKHKEKKLILSGKIIDDTINEDFVDYSCVKDNEIFKDNRIFKVCLSAALIIKKDDVMNLGLFDERFGIGAYFGAAEETDLILRFIERGYSVIHLSKMEVYHLKPKEIYNKESLQKSYKYALGGGALFKKHIILYKNKKIIIRYIRSIIIPYIKLVINMFNKYNRKKYSLILKGHIRGFIEFK